MFSVVLELEDEAPAEDLMFGKIDKGNELFAGEAVATSHGLRSGQTSLRITKLDASPAEDEAGAKHEGSQVHFFAGNPVVESMRGVLHLYRCGDISVSATPNKLPAERSRTICILGVPNEMEVPDLLAFLAPMEEALLHVRIIGDTSPSKYMVLIQFTNQTAADDFYSAYQAKPFSTLHPDLCNVVFVARVESANSREISQRLRFGITELPPCAVCLERLDESATGILTTLCNHTFHCACMRNWEYTTCPVCRHVPKPEAVNECFECAARENLWICLICGFVGCGRYQDGHSYGHFVATQHTYAMEIATQRVWDYVGDNYVHRLIQSTSEGKPVAVDSITADAEDKIESVTLEYTYLLTSQLESQRKHYMMQLAECESESSARVAALEREKAKLEASLARVTERCNRNSKQLEEEKAVSQSLQSSVQAWELRVRQLQEESLKKDRLIEELQEQVRDLMFALEAGRTIAAADPTTRRELEEGIIGVSPQPKASTSKRRSRGK